MSRVEVNKSGRFAGCMDWIARRELLFFWLFALLLLLPIWLPTLFVTLDGPAHLAVASLWSKIGDPRWPELAEFLHVDLQPVPNLTGYLLLRLLLGLVHPLLTEKILLTVYILSFALAARYFTRVMGDNAKLFSFLFLLLIYNFGVDYGFYNFILGVPLYIAGIAFWISQRDRGKIVLFLGFTGLSLACYFTHLSALALLIISVALLELQAFHTAWRTSGQAFKDYIRKQFQPWSRRWLVLALAHLPAVLLSFYFLILGPDQFSAAAGNFPDQDINVLIRIGKIGSGASFGTLDQFTLIFSGAIVIIGILTYAAISRRLDRSSSHRNPLTFPLLGVLALYLFLPEHLITHWIPTRLMIFLFILYVMWLAGLGHKMRAVGTKGLLPVMILVIAVYFAINLPIRLAQYKRNAAFAAEVIATAAIFKPGATLLTLRVRAEENRDALLPNIDIILQMQSYLAAMVPLVGLKNIQINSGITPVQYHDSVNPYRHLVDDVQIIRTVPNVDLAKYKKNTGKDITYILLWGREAFFQPGAKADQLKRNLEARYRMIYRSKKPGLLRVYQLKTDGTKN